MDSSDNTAHPCVASRDKDRSIFNFCCD